MTRRRRGPPPRIVLFGNSGSGKSTYARWLAREAGLAHLDMDNIVWEAGKIAVARADHDVLRDLFDFAGSHQRWVIEGCYGELVQAVAPLSTELVFMNPGMEACLRHGRERPWEPHKYRSASEQDSMLPTLLEWIAGYYTRDDAWSYQAHRRIFDAFEGPKREVTEPPRVR